MIVVPQPDAVTKGTPGLQPSLTRSTVYDFNTCLPRSSTDSEGQTTSFDYDAAGRASRTTLAPARCPRASVSWTVLTPMPPRPFFG